MSANRHELRSAFVRAFGRQPAFLAQAPGRVNLIGEHTDYNLGLVLPVAIDRTVAVMAAPGEPRRVRAYSVDYKEWDEFELDGIRPLGPPGWPDYVRGVAWALRDGGHTLRGADLAVSGDIPLGAGLSSSAALELAATAALIAVSGVRIERRELARLGQKAENEFVGVQSGIMDQLASALGRVGHALLIDCRSLQVQHIPLPLEERGYAIVVVDSRVPRSLKETPYNQRRQECVQASRALGVDSLRQVSEELLERRRQALPEDLFRRARHVIRENARVLAAADALRDGDLPTVGGLLYESHASLRDDFQVSVPQLDLLVDLTVQTEGVLGARLTGAGFGGCAVNLVERNTLAAFQARVLDQYRQKTGLCAEMHICRATDGLRVTRV